MLLTKLKQKKHKLKFKHDKEHQRWKKHFKKAHDMIHAHNKKNRTRYRLGHNKFSHMVMTCFINYHQDLLSLQFINGLNYII